MKLLFKFSFLLLSGLILGSCNKEPSIEIPDSVQLVLPLSNQSCEPLNSNNSIYFEWIQSPNADVYQLTVLNLNTNAVETIETSDLNTEISLEKGDYYEWYVEAKNETGTSTDNEKRIFYIEGSPVTNHLPSPAAAVNPANNAEVSLPANNLVAIQWNVIDLDEDPLTYTLYIDTVDGLQEPSENLKDLSTSSVELELVPQTTYYWSIEASDSKSSSRSQVFSFKTL
ncbi:MAG: hypothetical protein HWE24_13390 [Oceanospirillaceae bacterium]|nr:hypothetical protein [Oceanospirillaceae bacterium]